MQPENHTKEYSTAVILHAVEKVKFDGGRERDIATLLGVDPSNIPKYKDGSSKLSRTNIHLLIENYGPPKMAKGRYIKACLVNNVSEYITTFAERANHHFIDELKSFFSNQQLITHLTDYTTDEVLNAGPDDDVTDEVFTFRSRSKGCKSENRQAVIEWIAQHVKTPAFEQWNKDYEEATRSSEKLRDIRNLPDLKHFDSVWKDTVFSETQQPLVYLFGYFINAVGKQSETFSEALQKCKPEARQEVVVTGEVLLKLEAPKQPKYTPNAAIVFNRVASLISSNGDAFDLECSHFVSQLDTVRNFSLSSAAITLQINEQMMYRILVEENWGKYKSTTIIKDVRQDLVIEQFNQMAEFFGLAREHEDTLKSAIASRGGYIPGATML